MSLPASEQRNEPVASTRRAADPRRALARFCRADLVIVVLIGTIVLASACGGGGPSGKSVVSLPNGALAFVNCMRTHGEPNMPDPVVKGHSVHIAIKVGSGIDPGSPQFDAAYKACKYLTSPGKGSAAGGNTITPADQADYLKAAACMRSHGFPKFPSPVFQNDDVTFTSRTPIDTNTARYQRVLATCDKLIPAGLPYSGRSPSAS
jgi:hypothetical protein